MKKKLNIAYDYDMTLADTWDKANNIKEQVQAHCEKQIKDGHNVFIITARCENVPNERDDVMALAKKLGIPEKNVKFTCFKDKVKSITENQIDIFLEDNISSIMEIKTATSSTEVICVYPDYNNGIDWETKMNEKIEKLQALYSQIIHIASDHGGFGQKNNLINVLGDKMNKINDYGCINEDSCDYPTYAHIVAKKINENSNEIGILFCSTGQGMAMTANKYPNVRAALCWSPDIARLAREHNDANVLCLPSKFLTEAEIEEIVHVFLRSKFEGGRHQRRVGLI